MACAGPALAPDRCALLIHTDSPVRFLRTAAAGFMNGSYTGWPPGKVFSRTVLSRLERDIPAGRTDRVSALLMVDSIEDEHGETGHHRQWSTGHSRLSTGSGVRARSARRQRSNRAYHLLGSIGRPLDRKGVRANPVRRFLLANEAARSTSRCYPTRRFRLRLLGHPALLHVR